MKISAKLLEEIVPLLIYMTKNDQLVWGGVSKNFTCNLKRTSVHLDEDSIGFAVGQNTIYCPFNPELFQLVQDWFCEEFKTVDVLLKVNSDLCEECNEQSIKRAN